MALAEADDLADIFFGVATRRDAQGNPCDSCDSCDSPASMRVSGLVQGLRPAATFCDRLALGELGQQEIAGNRSRSQGQNRPQRRANAQESQELQQSQGWLLKTNATGTAPNALALLAPSPVDPDRWCWPHSDAMNGAELTTFMGRRDRLMRWGWPEADAEALADRLVIRDRQQEDRATCAECRHYRPGRCSNFVAAGLHSAEVGRELAALLQRCPGFKA